MIDTLEILSVNYNTPDLIQRLIESVRLHEGDIPIRIVDGSDKEPYITNVKEICLKYNVAIDQIGWNIHHGRGMNWGVYNSKYEWVYILDSDNYILQPHIEKMLNVVKEKNKLMCGVHCYVGANGWGVGREKNPQQPILYYHPSQFLINVNYYKQLKMNDAGFIHHGAPSIKMMTFLHNNKIAEKVGISLADCLGFPNEDYGKYTNLESRGTRIRFGSNW